MDALTICQQNIESMSLESVCDIVNMDIIQPRSTSRMDKKFDLIVMNPPFGTKNNSGRYNGKGFFQKIIFCNLARKI